MPAAAMIQGVTNTTGAAGACHRRRRSPAVSLSSAARQRQAAAPMDPQQLQNTVVIAGGGPAGLAAAVALLRVGIPALVLEQREAPTASGAALGLWTNAWRALDALGAANALRRQHPLVDRVELCRQEGRSLRSFSLSADCDGGPHEFRGVRRSNLVQALAEQLPPSSIVYGAAVEGIRPGPEGSCEAVLSTGQSLRCAAVVGADGVGSGVAAIVGRRPANYAGQVAIRGVARFPDAAAMPCDCIRQVWGAGPRAGMYPISKTELYWFVCFGAPPKAPIPATTEAMRAESESLVAGWGWGVPAAVQATAAEDLTLSRIADRWDLPFAAAPPGEGGGGMAVTLAGDALHPMTPNLGQGGCTALEDGVVLARVLAEAGMQRALADGGGAGSGERRGAELAAAFRRYERERLQRCLPLAVRSYGMGALLQLPFPPVVAARDAFVSHLFSPAHFLDHAAFDCGTLPPATA